MLTVSHVSASDRAAELNSSFECACMCVVCVMCAVHWLCFDTRDGRANVCAYVECSKCNVKIE